jgi:hypothetical protein
MASSYVNDLRLNEMATGDASGTWGETTNTNLELIAEAFSYGTEAITTNADTHTTTIADGATDPGRALYLKYTGTLDSACTITIGPNTVSKVWIIENGTSGSQDIILSQGSGANITIPAGDTKVVYSDGAGAGAAFFDAFASLSVVDLKVQDDLTVTDAALVTGVLTTTATQVATGGITSGSDIISDTDSTDSLGSTGVRWLKGWFDTLTAGTLTVGSGSVTDSSGAISFGDENLTTTGIVTAAGTSVFTNLDISGDIDVDGTTNLDVVDVDGAVNFAADVTFADGADIITASAGTSNFRAGVNAGNSIESGGNYNTVVGDEAGTAITTGDLMTAVGFRALFTEDTGERSTAVGAYALTAQNAAVENYNTAVGYAAGASVTTGVNNTLIGGLAGDAITTADNNTALGFFSLTSNTTGSENTGLGRGALADNTEGTNNTGVGCNVLNANTTADNNTAVGFNASVSNQTGGDNTAVGKDALYASQTGSANVAVGAFALDANTTASDNTAVGNSALTANTTGTSNTAVGKSALSSLTTATLTTAVGHLAGSAMTEGGENTLIGYYAGAYQNEITTGSSNTVIGAYARTSSSTAEGEIAIGRYVLGQGNGTATLGLSGNGVSIPLNDSTTAWSKHSDERLKENIVDSIAGLSFINDLRPVTYTWKAKKDISPDFTNHYDADSNEPVQGMEDTTYHGFLAQEVKSIIDNHPEIQNGHAIWRESPDGIQNLADGALMPMMVKAIQELSAEVETLKSQIGD